MKTVTVEEFLDETNRYYTQTTEENYELLVSNGARRNAYYSCKKLLSQGYFKMHYADGTIHSQQPGHSAWGGDYQEVKLKLPVQLIDIERIYDEQV